MAVSVVPWAVMKMTGRLGSRSWISANPSRLERSGAAAIDRDHVRHDHRRPQARGSRLTMREKRSFQFRTAISRDLYVDYRLPVEAKAVTPEVADASSQDRVHYLEVLAADDYGGALDGYFRGCGSSSGSTRRWAT